MSAKKTPAVVVAAPFSERICSPYAMTEERELTYRKIFLFWVPLSATWLMMSVEGPFLAAVIARLAEPKYNLAAYGVAFSFAIIIEAPVIMIMSASTALVSGKESFRKLRNFTYGLIGLITAVMVVFLFTPAFDFVALRLIRLPEPVARLTHAALTILLPWPGIIGYRRFYQGLLIRHYLTRRVAYGTVIRVSTMGTTALVLYGSFELDGALVGAAALSAGVTLEAVASRFMARRVVRLILAAEEAPGDRLSTGQIVDFYIPLALTSTISLAVHPMITFFLGQSRFALESLAVFPVINSLSFVFRSAGLSYQEVAIALLGDRARHYAKLRDFAAALGALAAAGLSAIAFTPLSGFWFQDVSGLSFDLSDFARFPLQILALLPALSVLLSFERAILVHGRTTRPITWATATEVLTIVVVLLFSIRLLDMVGVIAATMAIMIGRTMSNLYLLLPCWTALRKGQPLNPS
ncbi:MAG: hypothetical protein ACE5JI_01415 [Acidobacteriota bacterium]